MPDGLLSRRGPLQSERLEREGPRDLKVADAMLVVHRERFCCFAHDERRAVAEIERAPPRAGRLLVPPEAPAQRRVRAKCFSNRFVGLRDLHASRVIPARSYSAPIPSASRAVRAADGPSSSSCVARAVSIARETISSRLCS